LNLWVNCFSLYSPTVLRDALCDAHHEVHLRLHRLQDGGGGERRRDVDGRRVRARRRLRLGGAARGAEFEQNFVKPVFHFTGSRVQARLIRGVELRLLHVDQPKRRLEGERSGEEASEVGKGAGAFQLRVN
jgi:hypothetical protein